MKFEPFLKAFNREYGLVQFQIDSFNRFTSKGLQQIIDEVGKIELDPEGGFALKLGKIRIGKPSISEADGAVRPIMPSEARLRDITYSAPIYLKIIPVISEKERKVEEVKIGELPIMVRSDFCNLSGFSDEELKECGEDPKDPGGYFIINGTERVLVLLEEVTQNKFIVEDRERGTLKQTGRITSQSKGWSQTHRFGRKKDGLLVISFANIRRLPLVTLMRACGLESDKSIREAISKEERHREQILANFAQSEPTTTKEAIIKIGKRMGMDPEHRLERAEEAINNYLLPHLGQSKEARLKKAEFLGRAARKLMQFGLGEIEADDIDHYANKRLGAANELLAIVFRNAFLGKWGLKAKLKYNFKKVMKRKRSWTLSSIIQPGAVTKNVESALATGKWPGGRTGISQRLERTNFKKSLKHLRTVVSPLSTTQEHFAARELHATHWGRICPNLTPEGPTIGLRKNLALMATITTGVERQKTLSSIKPLLTKGKDAVLTINGRTIEKISEPEKLIRTIKKLRRRGKISSQVNISWSEEFSEVRVNCDSGRVRRPLLLVRNGEVLITRKDLKKLADGELGFEDLIRSGKIEFLDAAEEEDSLVAVSPEQLNDSHTHCEINPAAILGLNTSLVPYPEHDRGERVNYGAKMIGQSLAFGLSSFPQRADSKSYLLTYPQKPLVTTSPSQELSVEKRPSGQNLIVALITHRGFNMEDAVIMKKSAIERGAGRSYFFRTYQAEERSYWGGEADEIKKPEKDVQGYKMEEKYANLYKDGIASPESKVSGGDVLIGRTSPLRFLGQEEFRASGAVRRDTSETVRHGETGKVNKVFLAQTESGGKLIKSQLRSYRIPELGDKYASKHGQKGIIGLIAREEDMPFSEEGVTPDIIVNPHSIPSRHTAGHLLEILAGKIGALDGKQANGTAFNGKSEEALRKKLQKLGFRSDGKELLYNGASGEPFKVEIFIGPMYYEKLEHLVANKMHVRSKGPVQLLTKQPTEGKAKKGGLRLGEMERDCMIAHGASLLLQERFSSDRRSFKICKRCGNIVGGEECLLCGSSRLIEIEMSYAFKLLLNELKSLLIMPKLKTKGSRVDSIKFSMASPKQIKKQAAIEIDRSELYDRDGYPIEGGLVDPRLGTVSPGIRCRTCGRRVGKCPGHFGYIELAKPVLHVKHIKTIYKLLRATCEKCSKPLAREGEIKSWRDPLTKLYKKARKECPHCHEKQSKVKLVKPHSIKLGRKYLKPTKVRKWFEEISDEDSRALGIKGGRPEWFVITLFSIPPVTMRPSITLETGEKSEDDLTHKLSDVVRINRKLSDNLDIGAPDFIIDDQWELLQYHISTFFDNSLSGIPPARHRAGRPLRTLLQRIKGKDGRFRGNLYGKRVNFSSRSVISPDPTLSINEVGVPKEIAKSLTLSVRVRKRNLAHIKKMVRKGPNEVGGAQYVIDPEAGRKKVREENKSELASKAADGWTIERGLTDGDIVLFNRQPSLHRMSLMAHRVKVMPYKTFRLNLAVCPPYNADFDGDEMNLHVPQTEEARAEAEELMLVQKQIRSPRFGGPIIGCIQDYISGNYLLTSQKVPSVQAFQLLAKIGEEGELSSEVDGKEIFSRLLPGNLSLQFKNGLCVGEARCGRCKKEDCKFNGFVSIKNGKLRSGVIDESCIGAEKGKLLEKIEKIYGPSKASEFLDKAGKLGIAFLDWHGLTIGPSDFDLPQKARKKIEEIVKNTKKNCKKITSSYKRGELRRIPGKSLRESHEAYSMKELSKAQTKIRQLVEESIGENCAVWIAKSGARGGLMDLTYLAGSVGQQTMQGKQIRRGYHDRTLPHFRRGTKIPEAFGFVASSYNQGLSPTEYFFSAMNGREGLMDTSLRTRQSGYMERRLINALQDIRLEYDGTVRDSRNIVIQFKPAEDSIDPAHSEWGSIDLEQIVRSRVRKGRKIAPSLPSLDLPKSLVTVLEKLIEKFKPTHRELESILKDVKERYEKATYEPGEPIGVVTAQSISEPATQMTMRTFHEPGVAGFEVTKGLPRIIELVDARRKPKTPAMEVRIQPEYNSREKAVEVASKIKETSFEDLIEEFSIDLTKLTLEFKLDQRKLENLGLTPKSVELKLRRYKKLDTSVKGSKIKAYLKEGDFKDLHKLKEKLLRRHLKGIKGIRQAVVRKEDGEWRILTKGSSLKQTIRIKGVDSCRTSCNNPHEIEQTFGIEAARNVIYQEINRTLADAGLVVDKRHIMLIADEMTSDGTIKPIGRYGLAGEKASVLARAGFEVADKHLMPAAVNGSIDPLRSTVENVMLNQVTPVGTGMCKLSYKA